VRPALAARHPFVQDRPAWTRHLRCERWDHLLDVRLQGPEIAVPPDPSENVKMRIAERLRTQLQIIVAPLTTRPDLVLNRDRDLAVEFYDIGPPNQTQSSRPKGNRTFNAHISFQFTGLLIYTLMQHTTLEGVDVFVKRLLQMD